MQTVKKYWLITTEYPPFYGGGIGTYCAHTARMYSQRGHSVSVFVADKDCKDVDVLFQDDIRIIRFNPLGYASRKFLGYETLVAHAAAETVKSFLEKENLPEIIDCQEYNGLGYFILLYKHLRFANFKDLKVLVTMHAPSFLYLPYNYVATSRLPYHWIGEMEKFCINAADIVISPSYYIVDKVRELFPECKREIQVVRNPYYDKGVEHVSNSREYAEEYLYYGKASPLKGIFRLLKLFESVWEKKQGVKLRIVGDTTHFYHPERCSIHFIIKKRYQKYLLSGQLILEGEITPARLEEKLSSVKAVIIPSLVDNFPYTALECMNKGKVLLVSDSGGHKEIFRNGENGFVFSINDNEDFYQKLESVSLLKKERIEEIGRAAQETVAGYCGYDEVYALKKNILNQNLPTKEPHFPFLRQQYFKPLDLGESNGLLSVVVPYFNMGEYIEETIASIIQSSYEDVEIIIVNDGSTDVDSINKLKLYEDNSRIRVFHKANEGLSSARNFGASRANGEFLAFLDADDLVSPEYFKKALGLLQAYKNVFFVGCWVKYFGESDATWPCFTPEPPFVMVHNMANTSALVYKRDAFLRGGLNDPEMVFGMEDYDSLLSLIGKGYNGVVIPEVLFYYRVRKDSMARQFNNEKILYLYQKMSAKHIGLFSLYGGDVAGILNANGPGFLYDNPTLDTNGVNKIVKKILPEKVFRYLKQNKILRKNIHLIKRIIKN